DWHHVALSPDGKILASGTCVESNGQSCRRSEVHLMDSANGKRLADPLVVPNGIVSSLALSSTELAVGGCGKLQSNDDGEPSCEQGAISLWRLDTHRQGGSQLLGHEGAVTRLAFSLNGRILASGDNTGNIILWDVKAGKRLGLPLTRHKTPISSLAFSP